MNNEMRELLACAISDALEGTDKPATCELVLEAADCLADIEAEMRQCVEDAQ